MLLEDCKKQPEYIERLKREEAEREAKNIDKIKTDTELSLSEIKLKPIIKDPTKKVIKKKKSYVRRKKNKPFQV